MSKMTAEQAKAKRAKVQARDRHDLREVSANRRAAGLRSHAYVARPDERDVAARLAEIPPDTRNLTQRLCGDPLPMRSALYRKTNGT